VNIPLHSPNGAELEFALCFFCRNILPDNPRLRTSAKTSIGQRNFCEQVEKPPEERCLQEFRKRFR
jgi:hypothetical protein